MPAWPGGECPSCGEEMPPRLVHCQICRALLNPELESDSVEIPAFIPLREISAMVEVELNGYYVGCPHCKEELRINRKYVGKDVACKHCNGTFNLDIAGPGVTVKAFYTSCPHCEKELRAAPKFMGEKVACKHCSGQIHLIGSLAAK